MYGVARRAVATDGRLPDRRPRGDGDRKRSRRHELRREERLPLTTRNVPHEPISSPYSSKSSSSTWRDLAVEVRRDDDARQRPRRGDVGGSRRRAAKSSSWPPSSDAARTRRASLRSLIAATEYWPRESASPAFRYSCLTAATSWVRPSLRVGEEHARLGVGVQLVVDARVARPHRALHDDDRARVVDVEDRHAVDRAGRVRPCRRVGDVIGAHDERHIGPLELGVDLLHLLELRVGHVGLRQQHVHVTGHAPGHRMDGVRDLDPTLLEQVGQLAHRVLRLRHGEAVARNDDHLLRVGELDGRVVEADLADACRPRRPLDQRRRRRHPCRSHRP